MTMDAMKPAAGTVVRLIDLPSNPTELRAKLLTSPTSTLAIQRRLVQELTSAGMNLLTESSEKAAFFNPMTPAETRVDLLLPYVQQWQAKQGMPIGAAAPATVAPVVASAAAPVGTVVPAGPTVAEVAANPDPVVPPVTTPTAPKRAKSPGAAATAAPTGEATALLAQISKQLEGLPTSADLTAIQQKLVTLETKLDRALSMAEVIDDMKSTLAIVAGQTTILVQGGNIFAENMGEVVAQSATAFNALRDAAEKTLEGKG